MDGTIVIPQFVLKELQMVADSSDSMKRNRGRRGLDILQKIQKMSGVDVTISDMDFAEVREVDLKLIELARALQGKIVTNDFNLNKVAQLRGVEVLNINELANSLKPVVLPGEIMKVFILKEGKEYNQGVAYLDDGTMVVVDNARKMIGKTIDVVVTSVLQTTAGQDDLRPLHRAGGRRADRRRRRQPVLVPRSHHRPPQQASNAMPPYHWWRTVFFLIPMHHRVHDRARDDLARARASWTAGEPSRTGARGCGRVSSSRRRAFACRHSGMDRLEPGRTYVFVANHQSIFDIPILFWSLPYQLRIIAKESLGNIPFMGWHLRRTGHMLVDRKRPEPTRIIGWASRLTSNGLSLIVFPEGTRSRDGRVARFKGGSFYVALEAGLPVVPLSVVGSRHVMLKGRLTTYPGEVR